MAFIAPTSLTFDRRSLSSLSATDPRKPTHSISTNSAVRFTVRAEDTGSTGGVVSVTRRRRLYDFYTQAASPSPPNSNASTSTSTSNDVLPVAVPPRSVATQSAAQAVADIRSKLLMRYKARQAVFIQSQVDARVAWAHSMEALKPSPPTTTTTTATTTSVPPVVSTPVTDTQTPTPITSDPVASTTDQTSTPPTPIHVTPTAADTTTASPSTAAPSGNPASVSSLYAPPGTPPPPSPSTQTQQTVPDLSSVSELYAPRAATQQEPQVSNQPPAAADKRDILESVEQASGAAVIATDPEQEDSATVVMEPEPEIEPEPLFEPAQQQEEEEHKETFWERAEHALHDAVDAVEDVVEDVVDAVEDVVEDVVDAVEEVKDEVMTDKKPLGQALLEVITEGVPSKSEQEEEEDSDETSGQLAEPVDKSQLIYLVDTGKLKNLTVSKLKRLLSAHNLKTSGRKSELIARLISFAKC